MSIEYETARCENGETVPKDDYSDYYGYGGYAIRGPEDEQLAGRLDALLEKGDYPAIDRLLENADRTERDHATAIYKRVLERRNRLAECDDRALAVIDAIGEHYLYTAPGRGGGERQNQAREWGWNDTEVRDAVYVETKRRGWCQE